MTEEATTVNVRHVDKKLWIKAQMKGLKEGVTTRGELVNCAPQAYLDAGKRK